MAILKPFRAWRYNTAKVDISRVMAPPYDVISETDQEELYNLSDFNVVRLILGKQSPSDTESDNRYTRAKTYLEAWVQKGVLVEDKCPSFYLYEQRFLHPDTGERKARRALFASLRLEGFERGVVFPHEKTYPRPKADRLKLLSATHANLSPVFGLFDDRSKQVDEVLAPCLSQNPLFEARDPDGIEHRLWKVSSPDWIQRIVAAFRDKKIVLADGHHRYETALNHSREKKMAAGEDSPCDYVLISLVDIHDPGLVVLPTHRLLRWPESFHRTAFFREMGRYFDLEKTDPREILSRLNRVASSEKAFGICLPGGEAYLARARSLEAFHNLAPKSRSPEWMSLEVSILSYLVFDKILGIREEKLEDFIAYTRSAEEAFEKVALDEFQSAFILRPMSVPDIQTVCERKDLLPHKSTYFYPKLASGLVFYRHY